jgi:uncharacterized protein (TIGR02466 family)|tara:strand:+ start:5201 stop:5794 length:594 start_codon:yes stop_codon:yes gene_type:complete
MKKEFTYNFYYTGPLLFQSSLMKEDLKVFLSLCETDEKEKWNKNLAGLIKKEYLIKDKKKLEKLLKPYLILYKHAYKHWYKEPCNDLALDTAWVNYMKAGESNPIHTHTLCEFSAVFYLKMPKGLKKERDDFETSGAKPGDINFFINAQTSKHFINMKTFTPEVGDFFIFPSGLAHFVNSFKSKGERISVAVNFNIS